MAVPNLEDAVAKAEEEARETRAAARRAALKGDPDAQPTRKIKVRVLKKGHDKVSMGVHIPKLGEAYYAHGDRFEVDQDVALELEDRGFAEIVEEDAPLIPQVDLTKEAARAAAKSADAGSAKDAAAAAAKGSEA